MCNVHDTSRSSPKSSRYIAQAFSLSIVCGTITLFLGTSPPLLIIVNMVVVYHNHSVAVFLVLHKDENKYH